MTETQAEPIQKDTATPRVSVLMPVYNAEAFVASAIESILKQTYADFELLIIDDGSTDGSGGIVAEYATKDDRIRFISRENRGLNATLNELAALARAPYLARMDADDLSLPDRFEKEVAFLDSHPKVVVVGGQTLICDEDMRPIHVRYAPTDHATIDANNLGGNVSMTHAGVLMRAEALQAVGGYNETVKYLEDLDLWLRMAEIGELANLPDLNYKYRFYLDSLSGSNAEEQKANCYAVCKAAWERRGLPEQEITYREWRPTRDRASRRDFTLSWGWQAWNAGNQDTARYLLLKAIRIDPLSVNAWKGLIFGTIRHPR